MSPPTESSEAPVVAAGIVCRRPISSCRRIGMMTALGASLCVAALAEPPATTNPEPASKPQDSTASEKQPAGSGPTEKFYFREYRIEGAHKLSRIEVEKAVYPYLGPGRTEQDVEGARAALEKAYHDNGFQTVAVEVPPQQVSAGIVVLHVVETKVGRLRVRGSRYFSLAQLKKEAPSLAEGKVVDFNEVNRDILKMQLPDRQVTPSIHAGVEPGTIDVDLNVKDKPPLHASVELNNRYSANTAALRLNTSVDYTNLWQLGHSVGVSAQISPANVDQVNVFSGYYTAPVPNVSWLSLTLHGIKQNSDVATLGDSNSTGKGETIGLRANAVLPSSGDFYHSMSFGIDYKHYIQGLTASGVVDDTPISYYPFTLGYNASWTEKTCETSLGSEISFHFRGMGSTSANFDKNRYLADGDYICLRGDLSHTHDVLGGSQVFVKVQGQVANQPLVTCEQFSGGGLGTARGYLESSALGDDAVFGTVELRSPALNKWIPSRVRLNDWRVYAFLDAGLVSVKSPLVDQTARFNFASYGFGSRVQLFEHLNGSIDAGIPMISDGDTRLHHLRLTFRTWADF